MSEWGQRQTIEWIERRIGMPNRATTEGEAPAPKISVIVAVYNAEAYLDKCIHSILSQTFTDFEVLLIDDGSTDSSCAMCDNYAKQDSRIRVIHQSNGGVARARQTGIENARGEYSIHADPDDLMLPTQLEVLHRKAIESHADMVICDFYKQRARGTKRSKQKPTTLSAASIIDELLSGKLHGPLWNKLIRTSLYSKYNISFVPGLNYCEDLLVCVKLLLHHIKVAYVNEALYHYNMIVNDNSITRNYSREKLELRLTFLHHLFEAIPAGKHERSKGNIATAVAYQCLQWGVLTDEEYAEIFGEYKKYFKKSHFNIKRKTALQLSANGHQTLARLFIKKKG
jgi:glycosyltransferase involved in cell wall biosynthesis